MKYSIANIVKLAKDCHARVKQSRKYTGDPYDVHPSEVASMAAAVWEDYRDEVPLHVFLAVAWCHDLYEDTDCLTEEIWDALSGWSTLHIATVTDAVLILTDPKDINLNRQQKNEIQQKRLIEAPRWIQGLKLCDNYCNIRSIGLHDPDFAKAYLKEKEETYDKFEHKHDLIKSFIDPMVEQLKKTLESQRKCPAAKCTGVLVERLKDVTYIDNHGIIQKAKDIQGLHCSNCAYVEIDEVTATNRLRKFSKSNSTIRIDKEFDLKDPEGTLSISLAELNKHTLYIDKLQQTQFFYRVSREGCQLVRYLGNQYDLPNVVDTCLTRFLSIGTTTCGKRQYYELNPLFFKEKEKFMELWVGKEDQGYKVERVSLQDLVKELGYVPNMGKVTSHLLAARSLVLKVNEAIIKRLK